MSMRGMPCQINKIMSEMIELNNIIVTDDVMVFIYLFIYLFLHFQLASHY